MRQNAALGANGLTKEIFVCVCICLAPHGWLSGERVGLMAWWLWVRDPVEANFLSSLFLLVTCAKNLRKVVGDFGKKVVIVLVEESHETPVRHRPHADY